MTPAFGRECSDNLSQIHHASVWIPSPAHGAADFVDFVVHHRGFIEPQTRLIWAPHTFRLVSRKEYELGLTPILRSNRHPVARTLNVANPSTNLFGRATKLPECRFLDIPVGRAHNHVLFAILGRQKAIQGPYFRLPRAPAGTKSLDFRGRFTKFCLFFRNWVVCNPCF